MRPETSSAEKPSTVRQSASIRSSWTRLSSASPKNPSTSPRTNQRMASSLAKAAHSVAAGAGLPARHTGRAGSTQETARLLRRHGVPGRRRAGLEAVAEEPAKLEAAAGERAGVEGAVDRPPAPGVAAGGKVEEPPRVDGAHVAGLGSAPRRRDGDAVAVHLQVVGERRGRRAVVARRVPWHRDRAAPLG